MRDRFADEETTPDMLRKLHAAGPGNLITASLNRNTLQVTRSRDLPPGNRACVIIYGHGDLIHDLACYDGDWNEVADAVTDTTWDCLDGWASAAMRLTPLQRALRDDMRVHRMDLDRRPVYKRTLDSRLEVSDTYAWRTDTTITFTTRTTPAREGTGNAHLALTMHHQGQPVRAWNSRLVRTETARVVREAPDRARAYLAALP
ncbi:hypothetical protein DFP74_0544 [Nocardiopsis sp. Huas11]|nr:hypothetical protein DFP74_0544 [Nocardiopsis sp. Huas11]